jgi:hypothetical protein
MRKKLLQKKIDSLYERGVEFPCPAWTIWQYPGIGHETLKELEKLGLVTNEPSTLQKHLEAERRLFLIKVLKRKIECKQSTIDLFISKYRRVPLLRRKLKHLKREVEKLESQADLNSSPLPA